MASIKSQLQVRSWKKDGFLISTDPSLFPIQSLIDVFDSKEFYWSKAMPAEAMREMLDNSLCFGLYEQSQPDAASELKFVGLARCITDFVTFAYLTDVWVDPTYQGKGLGSWLVGCVQEVLETMPYLRRSMLYTRDWERSVPFYQRLMGMKLVETRMGEGLAIMESKGKGHPSYGSEGTSYN
ncbi:related to GNAT family N-acetyltransferase [Cephalotrichum gorgonifer]|uniref:Related to GNAT family N-acetyltransferase n=1 Tax=Cephalotrichum gorgonifer TaxID=2041049 RepID=A0AAE8T0D7_9PEZI|nr:related to GNAT family N-acetyltransferase [Cephalotrichum gorgonifer]